MTIYDDCSAAVYDDCSVVVWDVAIVGAGAAGLMTAITAAKQSSQTVRRLGVNVVLLDGREKIGAKILMSGGTRCNVTNRQVTEKDFESENKRVLRDVLKTFSSEKAAAFFRDLGIDLVLEPGGKYFPSTHSARTVLDALLRECEKTGVHLISGAKITKIVGQQDDFLLSGGESSWRAKTVVICTGGLSYPSSGSDGTGYEIAKSFGHSLVFTTPALTPLQTDDPDWKSLSGVSLPVRLTLKKKKTQGGQTPRGLTPSAFSSVLFEGPFLFTHFGFSGPVALNISRYWVRNKKTKLTANFLPSENEENFRKALTAACEKNPRRRLKSFLSEKVPERFAEIFLRKLGIADTVVLNQLKRGERETLIRSLFHFSLSITGVVGYGKAEATAGGVDLREVNPKTLESKLQPGLFFAGEILDVDGRIGGFNFQWAWSSGFVAGRAVARYNESQP